MNLSDWHYLFRNFQSQVSAFSAEYIFGVAAGIGWSRRRFKKSNEEVTLKMEKRTREAGK